MAEDVFVIKTVLDLSGSEQRLKQQVEKALSSPDAQNAAKNAGKKLGDSLSLGIEAGRNRQAAEQKELAHQRRLEAIHLQSANRLQQIEARRQAQIDAIRERGLQRELEHQRKLERAFQSTGGAISSIRSAVAGVQGLFVALGAVGAISFFENLARKSIDAAISIDRQVNSLKALTGSAEAARARFAELISLAQKTPGLTTSLAATLDTQLRILDVSEKTINRVLPVVGRLNAISPLGDPTRFAGNLVQLITQNFERQDLKELVGNSPFAGQLIKELFNVDSPTNAKAIRESAQKLGINTIEEFFNALAQTAENNPKLQAVTESLATQFEKLNDRIQVAIAPIGDELLKTILPAFKQFVQIVEQDAPKITELLHDNKEAILAVAGAFVIMADRIGQALEKFARLDKAFGIIRNLSLAAVAITPGLSGAVGPLRGLFSRLDEERAGFGDFESAVRPSGKELLRRAQARMDLREIERAQQIIAEENRNQRKDRDREPTARPARKTEVEQLTDNVKELNREIQILREASSKEFNLQIRQDALRETQRTLENIVDLRRKLNLFQPRTPSGTEDAQLAALEFLSGKRDKNQRLSPVADLRPDFKFVDELGTPLAPVRRATPEELQRIARRNLGRSGRFIQDAFSRGRITSGDAEALSQAANREFAQRLRETLPLLEKNKDVTQETIEALQDEIELYDRLGAAISDTESFMRGFNSQVETSGDIWARFGQNVSNAFRNVKDLFNGLKSAVLGFFNDLLGNSIQNLVRSTLGPLFGAGGGGGSVGGLFRTPSTFPAQIAQAFGSGAITAPESISSTGFPATGGNAGLLGVLGQVFGTGTGGGGIPATARAASRFGFNFGQIGQSLANAAPLLGLTVGAGLGGQSRAGNILGAAGGLLTSTFISTTLGAPGALGSLAPALFSNPITAIAGAGLLVGSILLGKAKQRKKDEEASGEFLTQALQAISELEVGLRSGQIAGIQARGIFDRDILGPFKQQIGGLKTESVRRSRLTNQVRDLENQYQDRIAPLIAEQGRRRDLASKLIPEFATGGRMPFDGLARLHAEELIISRQQQTPEVLTAAAKAGVPGAGSATATQQPVVNVTYVLGTQQQSEIIINGLRQQAGNNAFKAELKKLIKYKEV